MADNEICGSGISLGAALGGLALELPERSAWPVLAARLATAKRRAHWPLALAASLLALSLLPRGLPTSAPEVTPSSVGAAASQRVELAALMSESARLERLVAAASDDGASSASTAALSVELEDRLLALDSELEANRDPGRQLALWQQRLRLLRNVAAVESSRHYLAAQGRSLDVALVSAY